VEHHRNHLLTKSIQVDHVETHRAQERDTKMAGIKNPNNMSVPQLTKLRDQVERLLIEKKNEVKTELPVKMMELAKKLGMRFHDVLNGRGKGGRARGKVAPKYRDPKNPANTWTGRGRTPLWMVAAMKRGKAKKADFLI
jgi:DNA-binding protein H-NS